MSVVFVPKGRYISLKKATFKHENKNKEEDSLGVEGFDFGFDSETKSSLGNDMFELYQIDALGPNCDMGFKVGDKVVTYNNVTEKIKIQGQNIFFVIESNVVGVVE
jgi:hypothetical protein